MPGSSTKDFQPFIRQASESYLIALAILLEASKAMEPSEREKMKCFSILFTSTDALTFKISIGFTTASQRIPSHAFLLVTGAKLALFCFSDLVNPLMANTRARGLPILTNLLRHAQCGYFGA
jgi:hypothetical protein